MIITNLLIKTPIPEDVIKEHINKYISLRILIDSCRVNKYSNNEIKKLYLNKIKFLQKIYKKHRLQNNQFEYPSHLQYDMNNYLRYIRFIKKHMLYRYYIAKYPNEHLKAYPENLILKVRSNERRILLTQWVENNLPRDVELRTRRDIMKFFRENDISTMEITYAGW